MIPSETPRTAASVVPKETAGGPPSGWPATEPSAARIALIAAGQTLLVPGVIRLQPGLRHAVGRAARALFVPGNQVDDHSAADGVDVQLVPNRQLTLRIVTTAEPAPWSTARAVQERVTTSVLQQTGTQFSVLVVVVDVDADIDVMPTPDGQPPRCL